MHACIAVFLNRQLGLLIGLVVYSTAVILGIGLAGALLRGATVDSITWKNRIAGWLLPWSIFVGGGRLHSLLIKNAVACVLSGFVMMVSDRLALFDSFLNRSNFEMTDTMHWSEVAVCWLTMGIWFAFFGSWLWMLSSFARHQSDMIKVLQKPRGTWIPLLLPPIAIGGSVALRLFGYPWVALLVVGLPLLYLLLPVMLMTLIILIHITIGKPIRWN
jgi:hypothetical protein